jgi:hypothetical protein
MKLKKILLLWNYSANFEEISIFSHGGHLGYRTALTDTIFKGDHPRIISAKFGWDWLCSFRGEFFFKFHPPFFLICIIGQNRQFKIESVSAILYPRWPPLQKIEISSNGQNCSILRQKVPKFELYKHNDELFNIYYGIFYELWTFTDFAR